MQEYIGAGSYETDWDTYSLFLTRDLHGVLDLVNKKIILKVGNPMISFLEFESRTPPLALTRSWWRSRPTTR